MVASSDPRWLQWAFNALVGLFERVGLRTNVGKTVSMVCRPCPEAGNQSEAVYGRKMTGEGPTYRERQKERVKCGECGKEMAVGSLASHWMTQHVKVKEEQWIWNASSMGGRRTKNISDRVPNQGRAEGLPSGGLPRKGWDKDGDDDAFLQPACPGHCDHLGGGKPPTPKVLMMQHAVLVAGPKWEAPRYRDVQEWGGAENANGRDRTDRKHRDGLRGLREATRSGPQFQIPGADNDDGGRRMVSGCGKPGEGTEHN